MSSFEVNKEDKMDSNQYELRLKTIDGTELRYPFHLNLTKNDLYRIKNSSKKVNDFSAIKVDTIQLHSPENEKKCQADLDVILGIAEED
jgi:hypothetical protein